VLALQRGAADRAPDMRVAAVKAAFHCVLDLALETAIMAVI
jgi:hypothetical protein